MLQFCLWKNLLEAIDAVGRAGGTDPRLSPSLDASNTAKRKFRFLLELGFGAWVCAVPLSENTMLLLSVFLLVSLCWGESVVTSWQLLHKCRLLQSAKQLKCTVFCMPVTPHFPPRGSGQWPRNTHSAFEMKSVVWWNPSVTQQLRSLWSCSLLFFVLPFLFLHARPELHPLCLDVSDAMGEGQNMIRLTRLLCGCADVVGQCPLHL